MKNAEQQRLDDHYEGKMNWMLLGPNFNGLLFQHDLHFKDLILFYEHFHGETGRGNGASHQAGWTGLVAELIDNAHQNS